MPLLSDVITWVRRILKTPNTQDISDDTIIDYLNRFYLYDVPYRIQQFELKTQYSFETEPNVDRYNLPISTYNSLLKPAYCDGFEIVMQQTNDSFFKLFPSLYFNNTDLYGNGTTGPYDYFFTQSPVVRGFTDVLGNLSPSVYITAVDIGGNNLVVTDDGNGNLIGDGIGTVDYVTAQVSVTFNSAVPGTSPINSQTIPYTAGRPQAVLFYNNIITTRPISDKPYLLTFDAYLTPAAYLDNPGTSITFDWMAEYLARGTARKIMYDFGDVEQLAFYEPEFEKQEKQVLRRTTRQNQNVRAPTIFSQQTGATSSNYGQGT